MSHDSSECFFDKLMHCLLVLFACIGIGAAYAPLPTVMMLCLTAVLHAGGCYREAYLLSLLCIPFAGALILASSRSMGSVELRQLNA